MPRASSSTTRPTSGSTTRSGRAPSAIASRAWCSRRSARSRRARSICNRVGAGPGGARRRVGGSMAKKILMVTGGSRGIGAEVSLRAAKQGYALCINYLEKRDRADALVKQIRDGGGGALAIKANIADEPAVVALFEQCDRELGTLTHLVN